MLYTGVHIIAQRGAAYFVRLSDVELAESRRGCRHETEREYVFWLENLYSSEQLVTSPGFEAFVSQMQGYSVCATALSCV
jgi:hypothetical protein